MLREIYNNNTRLLKICIEELEYKVARSVVFLVTCTNKTNTCKASYTLIF